MKLWFTAKAIEGSNLTTKFNMVYSDVHDRIFMFGRDAVIEDSLFYEVDPVSGEIVARAVCHCRGMGCRDEKRRRRPQGK